jgi:hypothetical protein
LVFNLGMVVLLFPRVRGLHSTPDKRPRAALVWLAGAFHSRAVARDAYCGAKPLIMQVFVSVRAAREGGPPGLWTAVRTAVPVSAFSD